MRLQFFNVISSHIHSGVYSFFFLYVPANIGIEFNANRSLIGRLIKGFIELNAFFLCHVNTLAFKQNNEFCGDLRIKNTLQSHGLTLGHVFTADKWYFDNRMTVNSFSFAVISLVNKDME